MPAVAFVLTSEGKLARFAGQTNRGHLSASDAALYLERGVYTLVREGRCRAVGIPFDMGTTVAAMQHPIILLEHQDGSAYRIQLAYSDDGSLRMPLGHPVATLAEPKFFLNARPEPARKRRLPLPI